MKFRVTVTEVGQVEYTWYYRPVIVEAEDASEAHSKAVELARHGDAFPYDGRSGDPVGASSFDTEVEVFSSEG